MNYRHAYHAGNFADVVKHAALALVIEHLRKKDTPFSVIDTHAGTGCYDLLGTEAGKTGEYQDGIARLLDGPALPALFDGYLSAVRAVNPDWPRLRFYPGSPRIARSLLRPGDRLALVELHPEDARALKREFAGDGQVGVHAGDAYTALKALLPPKERRGLVLIDPPFEVTDEFQRIARGLGQALRRWPTGIYGIWYPIKAPEPVERFLGEIATFGRPCFTVELFRTPPDDPSRLNGSGLLLINPPWKLDESLDGLLPVLADRLDASGPSGVRWLVADK
ncbi:23S rRNA (adenine(2030)-N(6))-methyltransferase RlmJ [Telmatospirillum siberiense]|uniref:Ribosomal RNA large subunit methyltransferase J n=1 Tax=Telmatospirillum siberiense TaxID=382514 RepID=A0A2N3Q0Q2_9PROT|nr:23S rRNA (adenine(2030)-N(6))-methyltransferase RlmJ [Telmatospirillum siberiense]PKU26171.1 23S rRNA (adenine(2030)-N(6))-methyltransferase RlmJ [Telmatospirillum siberiense]